MVHRTSLRAWGKKGKSNIGLWFHLLMLYFLGSLLAAFWSLSLTQLEIDKRLFFLRKQQHKQRKDFTCVLLLKDYMCNVQQQKKNFPNYLHIGLTSV